MNPRYQLPAQEHRNLAHLEAVPGPKAHLRALCRRLFSFPALLAAGLVVVTLLTVSNRFDNPDLWWHLKLGKIIASTLSVPSIELFSHTAQGQPWIAHEWLAQLSMYAAYEAAGNTGLMLWMSVLGALLVLAVFFLCYRYSNNVLVSFLGALCAWFFATVGLSVRPLLLGHLFLVIELILLELGSHNRRWLWLLPPLFSVWVNCHGSYFFGLAVLLVYWASGFITVLIPGFVASKKAAKKERYLAGLILVFCAVALCCNPVGIHLLLYPLNTMFQQPTGLRASQEWLPPDLLEVRTLAMLALSLGIPMIALLRRVELPLRDVLVALMAFALAIQHSRMLFIFGIVVSPLLCRLVAPLLRENRKRDFPGVNALLIFGCLTVMVHGFPNPVELEQQIRKGNPVGAVEYIRKAGLSGPMLNEYAFGGYLIWTLPEHKVFIDGRGDVYDWTGVFRAFGRWATLSEDPTLLLDKYRIRFCILAKTAPMAQVLQYLPGWRKAYSDEVAMVFVR
jgi:hypothetical protein